MMQSGDSHDLRAPILLVDDVRANLTALEAILASSEYDVVSVQSGSDALEQLERRRFAVVLLDLQMPVMDGIETAVRIHRLARKNGRQIPIIFVTGVDPDRQRILRAYASGAVDFIQKPLEPEIIVAKVAVFADLFRARERLLAEVEERRRLERVVRARDDLLAIVAHDLRSPLHIALLGAKQLEALAEGGPPGSTSKVLGSIVRAVERMSRLVSDLLDLAKLEAGQVLPMQLKKHDIVGLTREVSEFLEPLVSAKKLTLATDLGDPAHVLCDSDRVRQVLANLIGNAIKFTPAGGDIHVGAHREGDEIVVSIADTGSGIPDEQIAHVFQRYWQEEGRRNRGAGLGLYIVKAIVDAHGGRVGVESVAGKGSTFHFALKTVDAN
jgi:signal transduction histidine kinase